MPVNPSDILSGIIRILDPANAVVSADKIVTFNGPVAVTNNNSAQQAAYAASDVDFNGQPSASFAGAQTYPLGDLSALTGAEFFAVLKLTADPPPTTATTGLMRLSGRADNTCLYPYNDGNLYDGFASANRYTIGNIATDLSQTHIYNPHSGPGDWALNINGAQQYATASNTVLGPTSGTFGSETYWSAAFLSGKLAYAVLCDRVQTPTARAAMLAYLKQRFAIVTPQDYVSLLGSNLVGFWHQAQGMSVSAGWADVVSGRVAPLTGGGAAPTYAVDSTNFRGKKVVQLTAGGKYLQTAASTMIAAGARPYVFAVHRLRASASWADMWALNSTDDMSLYVAGSGGNVTAQFKHPAEVSANGGAQDTLVHYDEAWLDGSVGRLRRDGVDSVVTATGSIAPAIDRLRIGNGQAGLSTFCIGICTAVPTEEQRAALAALIANDIENMSSLFAGLLTGYYARDDVGAGSSSWPGIGGTLAAVSSPQYKKDGYNFRGASVPTTTATAGYKSSAPNTAQPFIWAEYAGYVMVMGRFADLSASGCLIDLGEVRIYHDVVSHEFKAVWAGTVMSLGRADTEAHIFEIRTNLNGSTGTCSVYLDGVVKTAFVEVSLLSADATELSIGARLDGSEKIAAKVSRVLVSNEELADYYIIRARWYFNRIDSVTASIESILGSNLREIFYSNDAVLTSGEVSSLNGKRLATQITPPSSVTRPPFRYYDAALHSTAIDCARTGRYLRNFTLSATVLPAGSRPFVFVIGRLRTAPGAGQAFFAAARRASADYDVCIGTPGTGGAFWLRFYNATSKNSYGPTNDLNPHILGSFIDASSGSALWFDGATYNAQATGTASVSAAIDSIAVGANGIGTETEDLTFSVYGVCQNHPTTQELTSLYAYYRTKYLEIGGVTIDVPAISDTAVVTDLLRRTLTYGRRPATDAVSVTELLQRALTYGRRLATDAAVATDLIARALAYGRRLTTDAVVVTDTSLRALIHGRWPTTDTAAVTDLIARTLTHGRRPATDAAVVTDSISRSIVYGYRPATDAAVVTDSIARALTYGRRPTTDAAAVVDSLAKGAAYGRPTTDAVVVADAVSRSFAYARQPADAAVVTDLAARGASYARQLASDAASVLDQARSGAVYARLRADVAAISDVTAAFMAYGRSVFDVISAPDKLSLLAVRVLGDASVVTDTLRSSLAIARQLTTETISALDTVEVSRAVAVAITDNVTSLDQVRLGARDFARSYSDIASTQDALAVVRAWARRSNDAASIVDQLSVEVSTAENDSIAVADSLALNVVRALTLPGDSVAALDSLRVTRALGRVASDSLGTTSTTLRALVYARARSEAVATLDALIRDVPSVVHSDSVTALDSVQSVIEGALRISDAVATTDVIRPAKAWARRVSDAVAVTDVRTVARSVSVRLAPDSVVAVDLLRVARALARTLTQAVSLADGLLPASDVHRALSEALATTEALVRSHEAVRQPADDAVQAEDAVRAILTAIVRVELFDVVSVEDVAAQVAGLQKQFSDALVLAEVLAVAIERGAWIVDAVSVEDKIDNGVRAMHLIFGSSSPGPLFMGGTEPGRLFFSSGADIVPMGFVVRLGDLVATSDSIFAEAS
jgi:hypothetical protein